jgi:hypothetical protein
MQCFPHKERIGRRRKRGREGEEEETEEEEEKKEKEKKKQGDLDIINTTVDVSHKYSKQYYCQRFHVSFWGVGVGGDKILLRTKMQLNILRK